MRLCISAEGGGSGVGGVGEGGGVYPQTQVAQFFGESLAHPRGKSRRRRWWGEGTAALGEQSLISNLPKTGVFML